MEYTLSYDISSLILLTVMAIFYFVIPKYNNFQNRMFGYIVVAGVISCAADLLSAGLLLPKYPELIWANSITILISQLLIHAIPALYFIYMVGVVYGDGHSVVMRKSHWMFLVPVTILLIADVISPFTGIAYIYDETGYHRTFFYIIEAVISGFYIVTCLVMVFVHRKKTNYLSRFAVLTYSIFTLFAAVVQYYYPNLLVLNSSVTVSIFIMYLSLQNPSLTKDALEEAERSRKAAEEANAAKSVFLANISHEIRTPMNAIFGMTYLLEDRELRSDAREYINTIRTASENLLSLINDILDFSKADSGKMTLESTEYRLEDVIRDAVNLMISQVDHDRIAANLFIDPDLPTVLKGDSAKVRQVIINLLSNAIKFTDDGQIMLHVSLRKREDRRVTLAFKVKDTGIGIKEEDKAKIFQQFEQIDMAKTRKRDGAGLGLALVKRICEFMNGHVELESEFGSGSSFIAVIEQEAIEYRATDYRKEADKYAFLVIEPNSYIRKSIERTLMSIGCDYNISDSFSLETSKRFRGKKQCIICDFLDFGMIRAEVESQTEDSYTWLTILEYGSETPGDLTDVCFERGPFSLYTLTAFLSKAKKEGESKDNNNLYFSYPTKVAIVDDNKVNLKVTKALLSKFGIDAEIMESGFDIIKRLEAGEIYDLVFMDYMMPDMDGVETVRLIRAMKRPGLANMPIVALTANAVKSAEAEYYAAGMNDVLFKPVVMEELKRVLGTWLKPRSAAHIG